MCTADLEPDTWLEYFRSVVPDGRHILATVQVLRTAQQGDADVQQPLLRTLRGIGYVPNEDVIEVAVGGEAARRPTIRYFVSAPRRINVTEFDDARVIVVDDALGQRSVISLFGLPPSAAVTPDAPGEQAVCDDAQPARLPYRHSAPSVGST